MISQKTIFEIEELFLKEIVERLKKIEVKEEYLIDLLDASKLATDEHGETFDISDDPFLERILKEGKLKIVEEGEENYQLGLSYGYCHQHCLDYIDSEDYLGEDLYSGFALNSSGEWFVHTYLMEGDKIIDPTIEIYAGYFGVKLTENEIELLRNMFE